MMTDEFNASNMPRLAASAMGGMLEEIRQVCLDAGIACNDGETVLEMVRNLATVKELAEFNYRTVRAQRDILRDAVRKALWHFDAGEISTGHYGLRVALRGQTIAANLDSVDNDVLGTA